MNDGSETARWELVDTLFHRASELEPAQREAFLNEVCRADAELRSELDSLLESADLTLTQMKDAVADAAGDLFHNDIQPLEKIGAYRILRTLGEGGMGTVYLAARDDDQYERIVAIKVLRAGLNRSPALQLLFRGERQILADLDHPNIARMIDGGIAPNGSPYLVMEFIPGTALDIYCREHQLPLEGRLALFRTLCSAVVYAQQHMIIHRDLKPMNVLVTAEGVPKLLDFGISKLINPRPSDLSPQDPTTASQRLLTPDYASPEQLLGQPVTTATDVYALGVLCFELLTGELPCGAHESEAVLRARAICEQIPQPASKVCLRTKYLPAAEARKLRGDLDSILLKALSKSPGNRYPAAAQLLDDLERHLQGLPVEAVPASFTYTFGKFFSRHRIGFALAAAAALLIVVFAISMGLLARRATRGEATARREQEFLNSIFQSATPDGSKGVTVTAKQLLDSAAERLNNMGQTGQSGSSSTDDPVLLAALNEDVGQAYSALGLYDQAQPLLERSVDLTGEALGERDQTYIDRLASMANNARLAGHTDKAEPIFRKVLALTRASHPARSLPVAHALSMLGDCLYLEDKDSESESVLRQALDVERALDPNFQDGTRSYLALELERKGKFPEAAELLRESAEISARTGGREGQNYLVDLHNLAGAQIDAGDFEGAIRSDKEVLATRQRIWGREHPDTAYSLNNLGFIYLELGRWQDAEPLLEQNLSILRKVSGGTSPRYAIALANMGRVLQMKGDFTGANADFVQGQQVLVTIGRADSSYAARLLVYQSMLALDLHKTDEALRLAQNALTMQEKLSSAESPPLAPALIALGLAQMFGKDAESAATSFRAALRIRERAYPPTHPELLLVQTRLAEALLAGHHAQDAFQVIDNALFNAQKTPYPLPAWRIAELRIVRGLALDALGQQEEGRQQIEANTTALANYSSHAVKEYLLARIHGARS